jgi:UDPglucose 6-dehydrogenase
VLFGKSIEISWYYYSNLVEVVVFEPELKDKEFFHSLVLTDFEQFKSGCDCLKPHGLRVSGCKDKVYTCDLFGSD